MSVVALESRAGSGNWLSGLFGLIGRFFSGFYGRVSQSISTIGRSAHLAGEMIRYSVTDSISLRLAGGEVIDQTWRMFKVTALPALLMAVPIGAEVSVQVGGVMDQVGANSLAGAASGLGVVSQGAPMAAGLLMSGAAASAIASDLGARSIREEIDAMRVLGIDPVHRLVVPRVLASTFVALLLNGLVCAIGIAGGYVFSVFLQGVNPGAFINGLTVLTGLPELVLAEIKALLFGVVAGLVGCYRGLTVQGGPKGVGIAVNETVVYAFICLFVINVIMTAIGVRVLAR